MFTTHEKLKGILFDLDGTLVDSLPITIEAFNQGFLAFGGKRLSPSELMAHFGPGERAIFSKILGEENATTAYEISRKYLLDHLTSVPLFSGVLDILTLLNEMQVPAAIFTGRGEETTELLLEHHRIRHFFKKVVAHEHVVKSKPAPDGIHLAASGLGLEPRQVIHIGDSATDLIAAAQAGSQSGAALWDARAERNQLAALEPTYLFTTPENLAEWIQTAFNPQKKESSRY
jgi:pyrophosphatase PpaX